MWIHRAENIRELVYSRMYFPTCLTYSLHPMMFSLDGNQSGKPAWLNQRRRAVWGHRSAFNGKSLEKTRVIVPSLSQRDLRYRFVFTAFTLDSALRRALSPAAAETWHSDVSVKSIIMSEDAPDVQQMPSYTKASLNITQPTEFIVVLMAPWQQTQQHHGMQAM